MMPLIGFKSHTINRRTGRPETDDNWLLDRIMNAMFAAMSVAGFVVAFEEFAKRGVSSFALVLLALSAVFALGAAARHIMLTRTRRAYDAALAEYYAAIANAPDWDDAP